MRDNLTDITIVLDRSGSMSSVEKDTRGGFDTFVKEQRKGPGDAVLTLVQFDTEYEFVHKAKPVKDIPPLNFVPRGGTALLDALGRAIIETGERFSAMPEADRPGKVVFVIITDGEENSSKEYKKDQISEMVNTQRDVYKWQFVFLGANQDAIREGASIGIGAMNAMNYAPSAQGVAVAFAATAGNIKAYRGADKSDPLASNLLCYSDKVRDQAMAEEEE